LLTEMMREARLIGQQERTRHDDCGSGRFGAGASMTSGTRTT
jgi:hypothetical protein